MKPGPLYRTIPELIDHLRDVCRNMDYVVARLDEIHSLYLDMVVSKGECLHRETRHVGGAWCVECGSIQLQMERLVPLRSLGPELPSNAGSQAEKG